MSPPRSLASLTRPLARRAIGRKRATALGAMLLDWSLIVGPEWAEKATPDRLSRPSDASGGTLTLRIAGADALEVQHQAPQLIERINGHFGYRAVGRIRLVQGAHRPRPAAAPQRTLSPEDRQAIDSAIAGVTDDGLRGCLADLGTALHRRAAKR